MLFYAIFLYFALSFQESANGHVLESGSFEDFFRETNVAAGKGPITHSDWKEDENIVTDGMLYIPF